MGEWEWVNNRFPPLPLSTLPPTLSPTSSKDTPVQVVGDGDRLGFVQPQKAAMTRLKPTIASGVSRSPMCWLIRLPADAQADRVFQVRPDGQDGRDVVFSVTGRGHKPRARRSRRGMPRTDPRDAVIDMAGDGSVMHQEDGRD